MHLQHSLLEQGQRLYAASDFKHSVQESHKTAAVRGTPAALSHTRFILPLPLLLFFSPFVYVLFILVTQLGPLNNCKSTETKLKP